MDSLFNLTVRKIQILCYEELLKKISNCLSTNLDFPIPNALIQNILRGSEGINFGRRLELENAIFLDLNRRNLENISQLASLMDETRVR